MTSASSMIRSTSCWALPSMAIHPLLTMPRTPCGRLSSHRTIPTIDQVALVHVCICCAPGMRCAFQLLHATCASCSSGFWFRMHARTSAPVFWALYPPATNGPLIAHLFPKWISDRLVSVAHASSCKKLLFLCLVWLRVVFTLIPPLAGCCLPCLCFAISQVQAWPHFCYRHHLRDTGQERQARHASVLGRREGRATAHRCAWQIPGSPVKCACYK
jgi:hypothetical protein